MSRSRAKHKLPSAWRYIVKLRHQEFIPLKTTREGVRGYLVISGEAPSKLDYHLDEIDKGGIYAPPTGIVRSIHRIPPTIVEKLRMTSAMIKTGDHLGGYCWWNRHTKTVFWSYAEEDEYLVNTGGSVDITGRGAIRQLFLVHHEVRRVRVEKATCPDLRRDRRWVEVWPGSPHHN